MVNEGQLSERRAALRDALVASATRVIAERGYQGLRARDLAQEVGCALGAIYGVFPDLDALIFAVNARTLDDLDAGIAALFAATKEAPARVGAIDAPRQALRLLAQAYLAFASEHRGRWRALFEHRSLGPNVPASYVAQLERIFGHIERPLEAIAPAASPIERRLLARALFSAVHGIVALGLEEKLGALPAESLSWQVRAIVDAAVAGLAEHPELAKTESVA